MTLEQWGLIGTTITAFSAFLWTGWREISASRAGVSSRLFEERRDTIADRDSLIKTLREDLDNMRRRLDVLEQELREERDYTSALRDQIYRGIPPPPAERVRHDRYKR